GRAGLLLSCSFGPSNNRLQVVVTGNTFRGNRQYGIRMITASPHTEKVPRDNQTTALFADNEISGSPIGILAAAGGGEAERNRCTVRIDRNRIADYSEAAVRLVGGLGQVGAPTSANRLDATISRNNFSGPDGAVLIEAGAGPAE